MSTRALAAPASAIRARVSPISIWVVGVWVAAAVYAAVLSLESIQDHNGFETSFDTAIYDQLLWLLAHGNDPFSTVTNRPMLADHFQPGLVLLTPLYWLGLGVPGLLTAQSIGLALAAPVLYALARASGAPPALASIPAFLWLVCPFVASANLFEFRPAMFVPALLALSVLAALQGRDALLVVTAVLALSLKEDVSLTYVMLGILIAYHGRRRFGLILAFVSAAWFVAATRIIEALGDSYDDFGRRYAADRGDSVGDAALWALQHPLQTLSDVVSQSLAGLAGLFLSTGGLALLAPSWLLLAAPTAVYNALSAYWVQHALVYHYHLGTLTGLFIAAAIGVGRIPTAGRRMRLAMTAGLGAAVVVALVGGLLVHDVYKARGRLNPAQTERALERIPPDVPVAATPSVQPHLSQRVELYTFPEPFVGIDWGSPLSAGELEERARRVRFVAYVERDQLRWYDQGDIADVREALLREGFVVVARAGPLQILERP